MKRLTFAALAAVLGVAGATAAPVGLDRAKATAVAFMDRQAGMSVKVRDVQAAGDAYYIFNLSPQGWVIVSADDVAAPVLGYSAKGQLQWYKLPEQMTAILGEYETTINRASRISGVVADPEWAMMSSTVSSNRAKRSSRADGVTVEPLIQVNWDQGAPYNQLCPGNAANKAVVGCVAVAMSQAMSVQRYPSRPTGTVNAASSEFYTEPISLDAEAPYDWDAIIKGSKNKIETARLLRDAGYSVMMNYGSEGSGIPSVQVSRISQALVNNFSYGAHDVKYFWRDNYKSDWNSLILSEIQAGRAVVYNAIDKQGGYGHSFNIDGYDGNGYFHVNWGWGGVGNGNFKLDGLRDDRMGMNYDSSHVCVIGIGSPDRVLRSVELSETVIDAGMAAGTVVGVVTVNGEAPAAGMNFSVRGKYNAATMGFDPVPFKVENGNLVTTSVLTASDTPYEVSIVVEGSGERLVATFGVTVCPLRTIGAATSMTYDRATGTFTVHTRNNTTYTLKNAQGAVVRTESPYPVPQFSFTRNDLTAGENQLVITAGSESKTIIIKK